jgi:hypothetical protein
MTGITSAVSNHLTLTVPGATATDWHSLLRRGVGVFLEQTMSVRDFMTQALGMEPDYATNSVPGLFLNGAPVDDWRAERVRGGDEVGMSGTMPGLCGIALRRSSPISAFRPDLVSRHGDSEGAGGVVTLKMFNFVAKDCFLPVLQRGVIVPVRSVLEYLDDQGVRLDGCLCIWNGSAVAPERLRELLVGVEGEMEFTVEVKAG